MRVLGVDPGLSRCGVGVVQGPRGRPMGIHAGVIRTAAHMPMPQRLHSIYMGIRVLIAEHRPDAMAIERVFFDRNVSTGIGVAQSAGMALLLAEQWHLPVVEYTPTEVKSLIAGDGGADKAQVGYMVAAQLRLAEVPKPADAADALAVALCHLHSGATPQGGGMAPRLAAAAAAAGAGAQVVRPRPSRAADRTPDRRTDRATDRRTDRAPDRAADPAAPGRGAAS